MKVQKSISKNADFEKSNIFIIGNLLIDVINDNQD